MERELDRRSNDWSARLARFQAEEQRLRDRVMELAEQNVSFQREVTLFESKRVEASNKIRSLELQNKQLNDEMEKVKGEHTKSSDMDMLRVYDMLLNVVLGNVFYSTVHLAVKSPLFSCHLSYHICSHVDPFTNDC